MGKSLVDKKVNRIVRKLNRDLANDVFEDRFYFRQYRKDIFESISYYMYELCDKEQPERNRVINHWYDSYAINRAYSLLEEMNDFIITSDFWKKI